MKRLTLISLLSAALAGCTFRAANSGATNNAPANANSDASVPAVAAGANTEANAEALPKPAAAMNGDLAKCFDVKVPAGEVLIRTQSFVFDHAPYPKSCFITFAKKDEMVDERDVPRGSSFHIFQNGEEEFEFPDAFGGQSSCWVEAVGFDDLNNDGETDVIMAGRCLGAKDSYPTNAVFVNAGRGFTTNEEANAELDDLKSVDQIKSFVKKDPKRFFDN